MANTKKYVITSITLGIIASASAGLIGLTNLVTREQIRKNEQNKIKAGIAAIFGDNSIILKEFAVDGYKYTNYAYELEKENTSYALRTTGSNMYGKISMLVGFEEVGSTFAFKGIYLITDEQTYASTLEDKYVDVINNDTSKVDDVKCGATYGATLIKDMISDAQGYVNTFLGKE